MIEPFKQFDRILPVAKLNEDLKLIFLSEMSHLDLRIFYGKLALPLDRLNDHRSIDLTLVFCLNV